MMSYSLAVAVERFRNRNHSRFSCELDPVADNLQSRAGRADGRGQTDEEDVSCPWDTARWDFTIDLASSPAEHCLACWTRQPHTNLAVRTESDHYSVFPASLTRLLHFSLARVRRARACTLPPPLQLPTAARTCSAHAGSSNTVTRTTQCTRTPASERERPPWRGMAYIVQISSFEKL